MIAERCMSMRLAQLIRGKSAPDNFATATPATSATQTPETDGSVATVATVAVACSIGEASDATTAAQWKILEAAIVQCCNARGDTDEHLRRHYIIQLLSLHRLTQTHLTEA